MTQKPLASFQTTNPDLITAFLCQSCQKITEEPHGSIYECPNCGHIFKRSDTDSNRCPECNRFAAKLSDYSCTECDDSEVEEILAFTCNQCDSLHQQGEDECPDQPHEIEQAPDDSITVSPTGRSFHNLPVRLPDGIYIHDATTRMDDRNFHTGGMMLRLSTWTIRACDPAIECDIIIEEKESYLLHTVTCTRCSETTEHFDLRDAAEFVAKGTHIHQAISIPGEEQQNKGM